MAVLLMATSTFLTIHMMVAAIFPISGWLNRFIGMA